MKKIKSILFVALLFCLALASFSCGDGSTSAETVTDSVSEAYELQDMFFVTCGYSKKMKSPEMTGDDFSLFGEYIIDIRSECPAALDSVTLDVLLYDEDAVEIGKYRVTRSKDTEANTEFSVEVSVKKEEYELTNFIVVKYEGVAKNRLYGYKDFKYNVTYVYNNGSDAKIEVVDRKTILDSLEFPEKMGYVFNGWYTDNECTELFSFEDTPITQDMVLYAGYDIDYIEMSGMLMEEATASTVKITAKSYTSLLWGSIEVSSTTNFGEGVIIAENADYYYVLTTSSLLEKVTGHEFVSYTVEDSSGNVYEASLKHSSEAYDLGVLYFEKKTELHVCDIANKNAKVGEGIATTHLAQDGRRYTDFCNVLSYEEFHHKDFDLDHKDIKYEMMIYDSPDKENISGKAVYNFDLEIVGIQCGLVRHGDSTLGEAHAIPISLIKRYLDAYGI